MAWLQHLFAGQQIDERQNREIAHLRHRVKRLEDIDRIEALDMDSDYDSTPIPVPKSRPRDAPEQTEGRTS